MKRRIIFSALFICFITNIFAQGFSSCCGNKWELGTTVYNENRYHEIGNKPVYITYAKVIDMTLNKIQLKVTRMRYYECNPRGFFSMGLFYDASYKDVEYYMGGGNDKTWLTVGKEFWITILDCPYWTLTFPRRKGYDGFDIEKLRLEQDQKASFEASNRDVRFPNLPKDQCMEYSNPKNSNTVFDVYEEFVNNVIISPSYTELCFTVNVKKDGLSYYITEPCTYEIIINNIKYKSIGVEMVGNREHPTPVSTFYPFIYTVRFDPIPFSTSSFQILSNGKKLQYVVLKNIPKTNNSKNRYNKTKTPVRK